MIVRNDSHPVTTKTVLMRLGCAAGQVTEAYMQCVAKERGLPQAQSSQKGRVMMIVLFFSWFLWGGAGILWGQGGQESLEVRELLGNDSAFLQEQLDRLEEFRRLEDNTFEDFRKIFFAKDYAQIQSAHPEDPHERLRLALYREHLFRVMESEFYLSWISGRSSFYSVRDHVSRSNLLSRLQSHDFYEGLRETHDIYSQALRERLSTGQAVFVRALIETARSIKQIEEKKQVVIDAQFQMEISLWEDALQIPLVDELVQKSREATIESQDPNLQIRTELWYEEKAREKLTQAFSEMLALATHTKDQLVREQPWLMLIFEKNAQGVELGEALVELYEQHLAVRDIILDPTQEDETAFWNHLIEEAIPLVQQTAIGVLDEMPFYLGRVVTAPLRSLWKHNILRNQVLEHLSEMGDHAALSEHDKIVAEFETQPHDTSIREKLSHVFANWSWSPSTWWERGFAQKAAVAGGALAFCLGGRWVTATGATAWTLTGPLDQSTLNREFHRGVLFGSNSLTQWDAISQTKSSKLFWERLGVSIMSVFFCSAAKNWKFALSKTAGNMARSLPQMLSRSYFASLVNPKSLGTWAYAQTQKKGFGISVMAFFTSMLSLMVAQSQVNGLGLMGVFNADFYRWAWNDIDFQRNMWLMGCIEFLYVFRVVGTGKRVFSSQYFSAVQSIARDTFLMTTAAQGTFSFWKHGDLRDLDIGRTFFEAAYVSLFSAWKAKMAVNYVLNPLKHRYLVAARGRFFPPVLRFSPNTRMMHNWAIKMMTFGLFAASNTVGNSAWTVIVSDSFEDTFGEVLEDVENDAVTATQFQEMYAPLLFPVL